MMANALSLFIQELYLGYAVEFNVRAPGSSSICVSQRTRVDKSPVLPSEGRNFIQWQAQIRLRPGARLCSKGGRHRGYGKVAIHGAYGFANASNRAQNLSRTAGRPGGRIGRVKGPASLTGCTTQKDRKVASAGRNRSTTFIPYQVTEDMVCLRDK
jgi:hypothetical protein